MFLLLHQIITIMKTLFTIIGCLLLCFLGYLAYNAESIWWWFGFIALVSIVVAVIKTTPAKD